MPTMLAMAEESAPFDVMFYYWMEEEELLGTNWLAVWSVAQQLQEGRRKNRQQQQ